jgi:protoporphyrinogen IX oxidase
MIALMPVGSDFYLWVKALHVTAVITWMAGLFYLPRLYVYHASESGKDPVLSETFKVMERRLLRAIMNPSMIIVFSTGVLLSPEWMRGQGWLHAKIALVLGMAVCHGFYARWRRDFEADRNIRSHRFYRIANEIPTVLLLGIIALVIVKPF